MNALLILAGIILLALLIIMLVLGLKNKNLNKDNALLSEDNKVLSEAITRQKKREQELIRISKEISEVNSKTKRYKDEIDQIEVAVLSDNYSKQLHNVPKRNRSRR